MEIFLNETIKLYIELVKVCSNLLISIIVKNGAQKVSGIFMDNAVHWSQRGRENFSFQTDHCRKRITAPLSRAFCELLGGSGCFPLTRCC